MLHAFELSYVLQYGYVAFFLIMLAGELVAFVPIGFLLIATGALARAGDFSFWLLFALGIVASVLGNYLVFVTVRRHGSNAAYARLTNNRAGQEVKRHLEDRPWVTIFASRFIGVAATPANLLAGLSQMRLATYLSAVALGNGICVFAYLGLGYLLGAAWRQDVRLGAVLGGALVATAILGYAIYYGFTRKRGG